MHREQEGGVGAARRLQDLGKIPVPERRKLIQNHAQNGAVFPFPLLLAFVAFAHDELQVLEQHLSECSNRLGVLVDVERHEQDQLLVDHVVDRQ